MWNLETGQTVRVLEGHTYWVTGIAITPDGRRAVSASRDKTRGYGGEELALLTADASATACAVSSDGRTSVAGDAAGTCTS
jgi:WD40 repeat protein